MPAEELKTLRTIQWNPGNPKGYEPWVQKLQAADRLVIFAPVQPNVGALEWTNAAGNIWIGRKPLSVVP